MCEYVCVCVPVCLSVCVFHSTEFIFHAILKIRMSSHRKTMKEYFSQNIT